MNKNEIADGLKNLGLKKGDIVLLHSSLSSFGHVENGAQAVVNAFLEVLGPEGTLVVPAFKELGAIPETVKNMQNAIFSIHPLASVCAIGKHADVICADHWKQNTAFGIGSPYESIAKLGGYICLLGVDQQQNSSLHYVEAVNNLDYLHITPEYTFDTPEGECTKSWECHPGMNRDFMKIDPILIEKKAMVVDEIGDAVVRLIKSKNMIEIAQNEVMRNPSFFLSDNPSCIESVRQKAALSQGLVAKENFSLVASSSLAGHYIPEMIDKLKQVGIDNISLDTIQGKPVDKIGHGGIQTAVKDFRRHGCEVNSLRLLSVPIDYQEIIKICKENDIRRLIMPLFPNLEKLMEFAESKNIQISFFNSSITSSMATDLLIDYTEKGYSPSFTFNGANFARIFEKPFRQSYRMKLHRFIDQLDLDDCTFNGQFTLLGQGNADIKEMISILRCHSFTGNFVLTGDNLHTSCLLESVKRFVKILKAM